MDSPAYLAAQHMSIARNNIQILANNLANASTSGFQADRPLVAEFEPKKNFMDSLSFAVNNENFRDTTPGEITHTGNILDVAIATKDVYFSVQNSKGENLYTRNGQLELNEERQLVQGSSKLPLSDTNKSPITIPAGMNDIKIAGDGTISANGKMVAKIGVFKFANSQSLVKQGNTLMKASTEPTTPDKVALVQRGYEASNVNPVLALAQMIELQREDSQDAFVIETYKEQSGQQIDDLLKPLNV